MMARRCAFALLLLLAACQKVDVPNSAQANPQPSAAAVVAPLQLPDFSALVERQGPVVVNITVAREAAGEDEDSTAPPPFGMPWDELFKRFQPFRGHPGPTPKRASMGSGFIVSADGEILTNAHVVGDEKSVTVKLTDKREFIAKVLGTDRQTDVALVKIEAQGLPVAPIGNPANTKVGEWVAAIGAPFGFENSISAGIISAKGRALPDENYVPFIQTDVAINPGNSGGPLFNLRGEVIGVNSQIYTRSGGYMGISFAIPIDIAMDVSKQIKEHGKVARGRMGVKIQELSPELAKSFGLTNAEGALVAEIEKGGPAGMAGVEAGDVILAYNGKPIRDSRDLPPLVGATRPGAQAKVKIWRGGKELEIAIKVGEFSPEKVMARGEPGSGSANKLGLVVEDLSSSQQKQLGVPGGALVRQAKGAAQKAGVRQGDVVVSLNGEKITSASQLDSLAGSASGGRPVALLIQRNEQRMFIAVPPG
ncbi:MAG: DegQ family serine endoprotease [Betaproteobacteria bacterium]|nr:DegQ family serine endoprotease [Betaproteobacteria bacterium]